MRRVEYTMSAFLLCFAGLHCAALGCQPCPKPGIVKYYLAPVDRYIEQLLSGSSPGERIQAATCLEAYLQRPTNHEVRKLSIALRRDVVAEVRCAVAKLLGVVASRPHYRVSTMRTQPEIADMLVSLREALIYEVEPAVRVCIVNAACEFNSSEATVIIDRAKADISQEVREAAVQAERRREQRLRETGQ